ncbi:hypothetical protein [Planococcus donghaensis]|uniref:hypothetical protein n=1 Tax=Planococcus donghaensis TaxID=414778 RepID=UPI0037350EF9
MKTIWLALLGAVIVHLLYFAAVFSVGYVKTITYRPNIPKAWENAENLQSTAAFGYAVSPIIYFGTFSAATVACMLLLCGYKKLASTPVRTK